MKKILLFHFVTFIFLVKGLSQNSNDGVVKTDTCFFAEKVALKANVAPVSRTFCVGDKITVKLKDNHIIRGKISTLSKNDITTATGYEIDVTKIKWIKKSKLRTGPAIVGGLLAAGGIALFINVAKGDVDFDQILPQGGLSVLLFTTGIIVLTKHPKFKIEKGDKLIFKE